MRCPKCKKILDPGTVICPNCTKPIITRASGDSSDVLKPRSQVSLRGVGSRMSGRYKVDSTRHEITTSSKFDSPKPIRCLRCGTVNDSSSQKCKKCGARISN